MALKKIKKDDATDEQLKQYAEELLGLSFPATARRTDILAKIGQVDDTDHCVIETADEDHGENLADVEEDRIDGDDEPPLADRIRKENADAVPQAQTQAPAPAPQNDHPKWTPPPRQFDGVRLRQGKGPAYQADPLVCLMMHKTDEPGGDRWVPLSCNGVLLQVPRGIIVAIPLRYFLCLQHTIRTIITHDNNQNEVRRDVPAYPHDVKWMPPRGEIIKWLQRDATLSSPKDRPTKIAA